MRGLKPVMAIDLAGSLPFFCAQLMVARVLSTVQRIFRRCCD
jgi:hypothetical protein